MPAFTRFRTVIAACAASLAMCLPGVAAEGGIVQQPGVTPPYILIGFVGGFVRHNNPNQGPVRFAQRERHTLPRNSYVHVFENRRRKTAYKTVLHLLDRDHDGSLTEQEKNSARIVLFGHSWGASAVVLLARELDRVGVPVMLTVQVDSVAKPWQHDEVIPDNVAAAVNFYQPHGLIHGRSEIRAEDDTKTEIIGNYRYDYHQAPIACEGTSWFDRAFMSDHMQSECDPQLWLRVEDLVRQKLESEPGTMAKVAQ